MIVKSLPVIGSHFEGLANVTTGSVGRPALLVEVATRAVEAVLLSIQHPNTKKFWNGIAWQTEQTEVEADLANRGGIISVWSYALKKNQLGGSRFLNVNISATNKRGITVTTGVVEARYPPPAVAVKRRTEIK